MSIIIKFNSDDRKYYYNTFSEIENHYDYNKITHINCCNCNINNLPKLPNKLKELRCNYNNLEELPDIPLGVKYLSCKHNKLKKIPKLPEGIEEFYCKNNYINSINKSILNVIFLNYAVNPIYDIITKYFNGNIKRYLEFIDISKKKYANKIGEWFLNCKYDPKYKYCRNRLLNEYNQLIDEYKEITNNKNNFDF